MNSRLNAREVLVAELLGEIDSLVHRVEKLSPELEAAAARLNLSAENAAGSIARFETTGRAVVDHAQRSAVAYIVRRTNEAATAVAEQQRALLEGYAREAFEAQVKPAMHRLEEAIGCSNRQLQRSFWSAWLEHAATAAVATAISATTVLYSVRG